MCTPSAMASMLAPVLVGVLLVFVHLLAWRNRGRALWTRGLWAIYGQFTVRGIDVARTMMLATIGFTLVTIFALVMFIVWLRQGCPPS